MRRKVFILLLLLILVGKLSFEIKLGLDEKQQNIKDLVISPSDGYTFSDILEADAKKYDYIIRRMTFVIDCNENPIEVDVQPHVKYYGDKEEHIFHHKITALVDYRNSNSIVLLHKFFHESKDVKKREKDDVNPAIKIEVYPAIKSDLEEHIASITSNNKTEDYAILKSQALYKYYNSLLEAFQKHVLTSIYYINILYRS